jgi:hypothetical protein
MISTNTVPTSAFSSIRDNLNSDSTVTDESDLQSEKHHSHKPSTDAERMISIHAIPKNVLSSIRDNLDPVSDVIEESEVHSEKQLATKNATEPGILKNGTPVLSNLRSNSF